MTVIKHLPKILIGSVIAAGLAGVVYFGADTDDITADKVLEKYNSATEIKAKYTLEGVTLKTIPKNDPRDRIEVTIGDNTPKVIAGLFGASTSTEFTPDLKISRWDEVSLKLHPKDLDKVATADKTLEFVGDKIKFGTPDKDYILYELPVSVDNPEGGFEYEIILKSKPATNVIEFAIETKGLDFFYQPELTQQEIAEGAFRPENVVGSYAVFHSGNPINFVGGKEYKTGKFGHIFRPVATDANGGWIWIDLFIDAKVGIMTYTINQEWLNKAVFPVSIK